MPDEKADEYEKYSYENGIKILASIKGSLGAQMMRVSEDGVTEFTTIFTSRTAKTLKILRAMTAKNAPSAEGQRMFFWNCRSRLKIAI